MRDHMLRAEKRSVEIRLHHTAPEIQRHLADTRPTRNPPSEVRHDGRVVNVHIDLAESVDDLVDHPLDAVFVANVDKQCQSFSQLAELSGGLFGIFFVEICDDNFGLLLRKRLSRMLADTLCATRDDDYLILQHNQTSFFPLMVANPT